MQHIVCVRSVLWDLVGIRRWQLLRFGIRFVPVPVLLKPLQQWVCRSTLDGVGSLNVGV